MINKSDVPCLTRLEKNSPHFHDIYNGHIY